MIAQVFLLMILAHVIDDFVLQPICLSKLKQKQWWIDECKSKGLDFTKYSSDYNMALMIHSMSWSIMILLPVFFMLNVPDFVIMSLYFLNTVIHMVVDDLKCNDMKLDLCTDQIIHFLQIIGTFIICCFTTIPS